MTETPAYYIVEWMSVEDCDIKQHSVTSIENAAKFICDSHINMKFFVHVGVLKVYQLSGKETTYLHSQITDIDRARMGDYYDI
jgi:hypothetical protein